MNESAKGDILHYDVLDNLEEVYNEFKEIKKPDTIPLARMYLKYLHNWRHRTWISREYWLDKKNLWRHRRRISFAAALIALFFFPMFFKEDWTSGLSFFSFLAAVTLTGIGGAVMLLISHREVRKLTSEVSRFGQLLNKFDLEIERIMEWTED